MDSTKKTTYKDPHTRVVVAAGDTRHERAEDAPRKGSLWTPDGRDADGRVVSEVVHSEPGVVAKDGRTGPKGGSTHDY